MLEQVLEANPKTVKLVFKHFPLRSHRFALQAARAAQAADTFGKFWQFHDLLFRYHDRLDDQRVAQIADELGIDHEALQERMQHKEILHKIRKDLVDGKTVGVRGVPSVFINGRRLKIRSLEGFQSQIDKELKRLKGKEGQ